MKALAAALVFLVIVLRTSLALAHPVGLSKGAYVAVAGSADVSAEVTLARGDLASSIPDVDTDGDGTVDEAELAAATSALAQSFVETIAVDADGTGCNGTLGPASLVEQDGVVLRATYHCAAPPRTMRVRVKLLDLLPDGHRHLAHAAVGAAAVDDILHHAHEELSVSAGDTAGTTPGTAARRPSLGFGSFVLMGVEHILGGYDHLVFLFGLVVVGGRPRALVAVVTAFTVAHSITLALAVLSVWAPPPRLVEPAIALSIVYVGVENFFVKSADGRWRITFPFGLVHGFGFAGALRALSLSRAQAPLALVGFNVGVEIGQLAVLAAVVPLLAWLRRRGYVGRRATLRASACVVGAGLVWFVLRVLAR